MLSRKAALWKKIALRLCPASVVGRAVSMGPVLERMAGEPVPLGRPSTGTARCEHAGVLAGAVVEDRLRWTAVLEPDLEIVLGRRSLREQRSDGLDLLGLGPV